MNSPKPLSIAITGSGLYAATGDLDAALWAAIATRLCCGRPVAGVTVSGSDLDMEQPYFAPIASLPEQLKSESRIQLIACEALLRACNALPVDKIGLRILILTLLPASSPERPNADQLDRNELATLLRGVHPALYMAEVRFTTTDEGGTSHLAKCIEELHQGQWDAVLFGGADSLTDRAAIRALVANGRCRTDKRPEGTLPGEGAAYLLLEKHDADRPCRGIIAGLGHAVEENAGRAADCRMIALAESIEQALAQGRCTPSQVETIVLPMGSDVPSDLEWYQVKLRLWSNPHDEHHEMEDLLPQAAIGDCGAAALPLSLIIGCARFEFDLPPVERILVCECGQGQPRGAVFLKKSSKTSRARA